MQVSTKEEGKHLRTSIFVALMLSFFMVVSYTLQQFFDDGFCPGIQPGNTDGLYGLLLYPFFHSSISHLLSNLPPLFFLSAGTFYYLPKKLFPALLTIWLASAIVIWTFGRSGCHLGASGLVYGLAFMLATLGFLKKQRTLGSFALIIVFMYGSMIWGVLPQEGNVSWEGHAGGAATGILLALFWRNLRIYGHKDETEIEDDDDDDFDFRGYGDELNSTTSGSPINYHFTPEDDKD
ncbi:MAG: rhomboid family intramembrane serine protease [Salinivirgaceae bacterium]|nr:MAG: rhomboid family intramembrane serine protease [Salinivirgaceae bacterium]